jgi:hypothetical protein
VSSRRKRSSRARRVGLWIAGAAVGAGAAYLFFGHRPPSSGAIPVSGRGAPPEDRGAPAEEIHDSERQTLERVLRERGR